MAYFEAVSMIDAATGHKSNVLANPFIDAMGRYILSAHICDENYIDYGDAHVHAGPDGDLLYRYGKGVGSTALMETNTSDQNPTTYIFFNGARFARIDPGAAAKYYVTDNVGSTGVETDAQGNVLNASLFFPYGVERIVQQNDTANNYRLSGKERDPQTGLDDFGARFYDSSLGRFMTPDWDAKPTAVPCASFGDPQMLNLYSYVENGPLNRVDADGHATDVTSPTSAGLSAACDKSAGYVPRGSAVDARQLSADSSRIGISRRK